MLEHEGGGAVVLDVLDARVVGGRGRGPTEGELVLVEIRGHPTSPVPSPSLVVVSNVSTSMSRDRAPLVSGFVYAW